MSNSNWVHINVAEIIRETDAAFLVVFDDDEQVWIPKSQIADVDQYNEGDTAITLSVTPFIAKEKDLEQYQ